MNTDKWDEFVRLCTEIDSQYDAEILEDGSVHFYPDYTMFAEDDCELEDDYE